MPQKRNLKVFIVAAVIIVILVGEIIWAKDYLSRMSQSSKMQPTASFGDGTRTTPSAPQPKRLPQGRQAFTVSSSDTSRGPQFSEIVVDPYDPRNGQEQVMSIKITDTEPVIKVAVTVATDNGRKTYPMKLASGEAGNGVWEAKWKVEDTHDTAYNASFMAQDSTYTDTVTLTMR